MNLGNNIRNSAIRTLVLVVAPLCATAVNARLISSAKFGGGILGHLESGGTVVLRQDDVGDGHWQPVFVDVNMHGRVLFLSLSLHQQISHTEYERLPDALVPTQIISLIIKDSNAENAELR